MAPRIPIRPREETLPEEYIPGELSRRRLLFEGTHNEWRQHFEAKLRRAKLFAFQIPIEDVLGMISVALRNRIPDDLKDIDNQGVQPQLLAALPAYSAPFRFMELPPMIRRKIYCYAGIERLVRVPLEKPIFMPVYMPNGYTSFSPPALGHFPAIAHCNRVMREEALPLIYQHMILDLRLATRGWDYFFDFMSRPEVRPYIRYLGQVMVAFRIDAGPRFWLRRSATSSFRLQFEEFTLARDRQGTRIFRGNTWYPLSVTGGVEQQLRDAIARYSAGKVQESDQGEAFIRFVIDVRQLVQIHGLNLEYMSDDPNGIGTTDLWNH